MDMNSGLGRPTFFGRLQAARRRRDRERVTDGLSDYLLRDVGLVRDLRGRVGKTAIDRE